MGNIWEFTKKTWYFWTSYTIKQLTRSPTLRSPTDSAPSCQENEHVNIPHQLQSYTTNILETVLQLLIQIVYSTLLSYFTLLLLLLLLLLFSILMAIFPGGPGLTGTRMSSFWILLKLRMMEVVVTTGIVRHAKLQSNHHHQQTNTQFSLQAGCTFWHPSNSVTAPKENYLTLHKTEMCGRQTHDFRLLNPML